MLFPESFCYEAALHNLALCIWARRSGATGIEKAMLLEQAGLRLQPLDRARAGVKLFLTVDCITVLFIWRALTHDGHSCV